jgi:hypothetical protein
MRCLYNNKKTTEIKDERIQSAESFNLIKSWFRQSGYCERSRKVENTYSIGRWQHS